MRISPWWLLVAAVAAGAALTGITSVIDGDAPSALEWLGTSVGVAALIIAVGIYRLQERSGSEAHAELMSQIEAQGELLNEFAGREEAGEEAPGPATSPTPTTTPAGQDLTPAQRAQVEADFGEDSIEAAFDPGRGRGRRARARLVRLRDGRLVSVYEDPRRDRITVREINRSRRSRRPSASDRP
jgi:hypothetical protein